MNDQRSAVLGVPSAIVKYQNELLRVLMGIEYTLYVKTQNYHWNVTGMSFSGIHKLLEEQYKGLQEFIDRIAEQIRKYGSAAPGSMAEFIQLNNSLPGTNIPEVIGSLLGQEKMLDDLRDSNERVCQFINNLSLTQLDLAIQNLLGEVLDLHMKNAWMLRAHFQ